VAFTAGSNREVGSRLRLTNCLVMSRASLYTWLDESVPTHLQFHHCTIVGSFVLAPHGQTTPLRTETVGSVFSIRRPISAPSVVAYTARDGWSGRSNAYSPNAQNVLFEIPPSDEHSRTIPLGITDRIRDKGGSGERLTPADFSLTREEIGRLGWHPGATVEHVGPGDSWHRARRMAAR
jgi:hypothetical protein